MTTSRLQAIKARAAAAPGGDWYVEPDGSVWVAHGAFNSSGLTGPFPAWAEGAAEFIAASRADVDWLVQQVEELAASRDEAYAAGFEQVRRRCVQAEAHNDALQARLDAVTAVVDKWEATQAHNRDQLRAGGLLKTTPTPEAFRAALNGDPDVP